MQTQDAGGGQDATGVPPPRIEGTPVGHLCQSDAVVDCLLCAREPAIVEVPVATDPGDAFALPAHTPVGATCFALLESGDDGFLAERLASDFEDFGATEVVAHLHRRAGQATVISQNPVAAARLEAQGFVPLDEHTGVGAELGPLWPASHRISRLALGEPVEDPADLWLVRSPWGSLTVPEVMIVLWNWVDRDPYPQEEAACAARVREVFGFDEDAAQRMLLTE